MALTKLITDLNIIAALDDEPNDVGGLTAAQLKAEFDEAGNTVKAYVNETLTVELDDNFATKAEAQAVVLGQIPDGTITEAKLETTLATTINNAAQADDLVDTATTLSDAVKTALALTGTKYVSDALTKLSGAALRDTTSGNKLVDMSGTEFTLPYAKIATGSYTGTGAYGSDSPNVLIFSGEPKMLQIGVKYSNQSYYWSGGSLAVGTLNNLLLFMIPNDNTYREMKIASSVSWNVKKSTDGKTVSWYSAVDAEKQCNYSSAIYSYLVHI